MKKLLKAEPVMAFGTLLSLILAALIVAGKLTLDDVSHYVAVFGAVAAVVVPFLAALVVRSQVTPTTKG